MAQNLSQEKQVSSVFRSKNYDRYKSNDLNRELKQPHLKWLMEQMLKYGYIKGKPIIVNEKNEIIDGHHRFLAAKSLGIPVLVQICKGMKDEDILQVNQDQINWDKHNYTGFWAKKGNQHYKAIQDFMIANPKFKMTQTLILLSNEPNAHPKSEAFQKGKFITKSYAKAQEYANWINEIANTFNKAYTSKFISALIVCDMKCKEFSFKDFIEKLQKFPDKMQPRISTRNYVENIQEVYNYHRPKKHQIDLSHLIREFKK